MTFLFSESNFFFIMVNKCDVHDLDEDHVLDDDDVLKVSGVQKKDGGGK